MEVITQGPVDVSSSADGKLKTFLSKEKGKIKAGHQARVEKRAARRAKRNARPLTKTGQWFHDHLPHVKKKTDGTFSKTLPDGTEKTVPAANVNQLPGTGVLVDKTDANGKKLVTDTVAGAPTAATQYAANETVQATAPDGSIQTYKATDTEDGESTDDGTPADGSMSTTTMVLLGVGALVVIGAIVYFVKRGKKK